MKTPNEPTAFSIKVGSPIKDYIISNTNNFVAVSTEDNFLKIWDFNKTSDPKYELEFNSTVNSLHQIKNSNLIVASYY